VVLIARITAAIAALVWFVGAPLVSLAGVPLPSDAQYMVIGTMAALLGLTLAPLTLTIGSPARGRMKAIIQFSGLAICIALIGAGVVLVLAANGRLGDRAPGWATAPAFVCFAGLFLWVSLASSSFRGRSTIDRGIFWLGMLTGVSFLVPFLGSILMFYLFRDFVITNATILPLLLATLLVWVSLPSWLTLVVIGLSEKSGVGPA